MFHKEELELAIHAAADVPGDRVVRCAVRSHALRSAHRLHERAPFSYVGRKPRSQEDVVLLYPKAVKAAGVEYHAHVRVSGKGKVFQGSIPSAERIAVYDIHGIAVSHSNIYIPTREQLRSRCGGKQHKAHKRQ